MCVAKLISKKQTNKTISIISKTLLLKKYALYINLLILPLLFLSIIIINILHYDINIDNNINTIDFEKLNTKTIGKNNNIKLFLNKQNDLLNIISDISIVKNDDSNILKDCFIITPNIRKKRYEGPTALIEINTNNEFKIPNKMFLVNQKTNYISTKELHGNLKNSIISDLDFSINDEDLFLSGDNLFFNQETNYKKKTKNSHLRKKKKKKDDTRQKQNFNDKNGKLQNNNLFYDLKSEKMEVFFEKKIAEFTTKVVFNNEENVVKSNFAKIYFDEKMNIKDIFLKGKVFIYNGKDEAKSTYGYYDTERKKIILYKNIKLSNETGWLNSDIYIYNTDEKSGMNFNQNTIFPKKEQEEIYKILLKLSKELKLEEKKKIIATINNNKEFIKRRAKYKHDDDNSNIDRSKRAKIKLLK